MWNARITDIWDAVKAALAGDGSFNVTLVGGATGGSTVAQGDPQADGTKAWPMRLFDASGALLGRLAAAASLPVVLSTEDLAAISALATETTLAALVAANHTDLAAILAKQPTTPALEGGNLAAIAASLVALQQPTKLTAVTPSDATNLTTTATKGIWIGGAGDLSVKLTGDSGATSILAVPAGRFLPGSFARVMAATTATSIVAFS